MIIYDYLASRGFDTIDRDFYNRIDVWRSWFDGDVRNFHSFSVFNGQKRVQCRRYSVGMAKKVCEDWASLLMNEKVKVTLEGEAEQEAYDAVTDDNAFAVKSNEAQELKASRGTVAYVCRAENAVISSDGRIIPSAGARIRIDYVTAENIYPLSWENGYVSECAFAKHAVVGGDPYLFVTIHLLQDGEYVIENHLFAIGKGGSLTEVDLTDVRGYESIPPVVFTGSADRQFVIDRLNIVNNLDPSSPMGISVYANCIDQLKGVDIAYDSYVNEFVLGKKRIIVKPEATKDLDGQPIFDINDVTFYVLPEDGASGSVVEPIDMALRTNEHSAGLQDMLNELSAKCGFGEQHYKWTNGAVATATQIISQNSSLFRNVKKHEIILRAVLEELARIILRMENAYRGTGLNEDVEISIDFDDSIIEDKATEFARDLQMLSAGILNAYEFRMKWMNEDEETAKAALPQMNDLLGGGE